MTQENLPLLKLFLQLRSAGLPITIDDYQLVLSAMQSGFGFPKRQDLFNLCCTLWVKSKEQEQILETYFNQSFAPPSVDEEISSFEIPLSNTESVETTPEKPKLTSTPPPSFVNVPLVLSNPHLGTPTDKQVGTAIANFTSDSRSDYNYSTDGYYPPNLRQIQQNWSALRLRVREGRPVELDLAATCDRIAAEGNFFTPVLVPPWRKRTDLLLLIDRQGSMMPFHYLSRQLSSSLERGGNLNIARCYYFHNYIDDELYTDLLWGETQLTAKILEELNPDRTVTIIFSDAGAARGAFNIRRVAATEAFLAELRSRTRSIIWLNPIPSSRWQNTTAAAVSQQLAGAMFEFTPQGLVKAIALAKNTKKPGFSNHTFSNPK